MADDQDNVVLRLLREIRGQQVEDSQRLQRLARHLEEMPEQVVTAMGIAGLASVSTEKHGEGMDEIRDEITALKRRVRELETRS